MNTRMKNRNSCKTLVYGEVIPTSGHNYEENIITAPTCTQTGLMNTVCKKLRRHDTGNRNADA